jgi:rubrerythrin
MGDKSSLDILKQAYEGEYEGIAMAEELVKGDLDNESATLVQNILSDDQAHLKKMKSIMEGLQNVH